MNETSVFLLTFIIYIISAVFYFSYFFSKRTFLAGIGYKAAIIGLVTHTAALILRTIESRHAPFTNMYESLSFLSWSAILAYVIIEGKFKIRKAGPFFILIVIALMALASSPLMPKEATPLVPALQSYWLWLHVSITLLGEAFFAIAFITSILYLIADSNE
ncbi:MAG TPA: c-type cytochrome biogenesis protein CcsB, partial [bacterium]|nr:c-type cytochrome biogenesis protein CcsB [bacterium]